jgi:hypothetical protein
MALATILSADIAGQTPHGQADARLMAGLAAWIDAHKAEVAGFDPAVPTAEQIDRLSDDQFRAIARGLDPELKPR